MGEKPSSLEVVVGLLELVIEEQIPSRELEIAQVQVVDNVITQDVV